MSDPAAPRPAGLLAKLLAAEPAEVGLFVEAAAALALARVALRAVSIRTLFRLLAQFGASRSGSPTPLRAAAPAGCVRALASAVDSVSGRFGGACLERSVTLAVLLARRGIDSTVVLAVRARGAPLPGHAWVEVDGEALGMDGRSVAAAAEPPFAVLTRLASGPGAAP